MSKHVNDKSCPSCEEKLKNAHPDLAAWFSQWVKPKHPDAHISWTYRDEKSQNEAVVEGKSKLKFPLSAHNKSNEQGAPCARALDLFKLSSSGLAQWPWPFFRMIADEVKAISAPIQWGGQWKSLGDADHFEFKES